MRPHTDMMLMPIRRILFIVSSLADFAHIMFVMTPFTVAGTNGLADRLRRMISITNRRTSPGAAASKLLSGKADEHRE